ncbi:hypothetical protein H0H93_003162, partial [Arthromyces matolae]
MPRQKSSQSTPPLPTGVENCSAKVKTAMQMFVKQAARDPSVYLSRLVDKLRVESPCAWTSHPRIIQLLLRQFETDPYDLKDPTLCVLLALAGLYYATPLDDVKTDEIMDEFASHWSNLWRWLNLVYHSANTVSPANLFDDDVLRGIEMIVLLVADQVKYPFIVSTEGFFRMCLAIHLNFPTRPTNKGSAAARLTLTSNILLRLIANSKAKPIDIRKEIGFDRRKAARRMFLPGTMCIQGDPSWRKCFVNVQRVHAKFSETFPEVYQSFSPDVVMSYICDSFSFALTPKAVDPYDIGITVLFLINYIHIVDGHAWVVHGLRKNLLSLFIAASNAFPDGHPGMKGAYSFLELFIGYSIHRPIMRLLNNFEIVVNPIPINHLSVQLQLIRISESLSWARQAHKEFKAMGIVPCSYAKRPYTKAYLDFLMRREIEGNLGTLQVEAAKIKQCWPPTIAPYVLIFDLTCKFPPYQASLTQLEPDKIPLTGEERQPFILPCVKFRYGNKIHVRPSAINVS